MSTFLCGCPYEPRYPEQRCAEHRKWGCHDGIFNEEWAHPNDLDPSNPDRTSAVRVWCPPCKRAALLSKVS